MFDARDVWRLQEQQGDAAEALGDAAPVPVRMPEHFSISARLTLAQSHMSVLLTTELPHASSASSHF